MTTDPIQRRWNTITTRAKAQHGVVTRAQVLATGLTRHQVVAALSSGQLRELGRGVYGVAGLPQTWEQRVLAACLATGGVASHRTAGWLFGLEGLGRSAPREVDIIVPFTGSPLSKLAIMHRSRTLQPSHAVKLGAIPRTTLARTLIDLAEVLEPKALETAFASALRQQPDLRGAVLRLVKDWPNQGHTGIGALRALLAPTRP
jgi:predicted transcriptional regulator of viral defense system